MLFMVGIERPQNDNEAFGMIVPAFDQAGPYGCISAADSESDILHQVRDAILTMAEEVANDGVDLDVLDFGYQSFADHPDYQDYQEWVAIDVDVESVVKTKRVNVVLANGLLDRVDSFVEMHNEYKDRSHFLSVAANQLMVGDSRI